MKKTILILICATFLSSCKKTDTNPSSSQQANQNGFIDAWWGGVKYHFAAKQGALTQDQYNASVPLFYGRYYIFKDNPSAWISIKLEGVPLDRLVQNSFYGDYTKTRNATIEYQSEHPELEKYAVTHTYMHETWSDDLTGCIDVVSHTANSIDIKTTKFGFYIGEDCKQNTNTWQNTIHVDSANFKLVF